MAQSEFGPGWAALSGRFRPARSTCRVRRALQSAIAARNSPNWLIALRQDVASAFTFGVGFGSILATLHSLRLPLELVAPVECKRAFGLTSDKRASLDKARLLFLTADLQLLASMTGPPRRGCLSTSLNPPQRGNATIIYSIELPFLAFGIVLGAALRPHAMHTVSWHLGSRCANTNAVTSARHTPRSRPSNYCSGRDGPEHPPAVMVVLAFASGAHRV